MTGARVRPLSSLLLAMVCVAMLGATSLLSSVFVVAVEKVLAEIRLLADDGFIQGGTGNPLPDPAYVADVISRYLQPSSPLFDGQTTFGGFDFTGVTSPQEFCPITACPAGGLTFGSSLFTGAGIYNQAVHPFLTADEPAAIFGYSQSATSVTAMMDLLQEDPGKFGYTAADLAKLDVAVIGDPNTPTGGILDRFQFPDGIEKFSLTPTMQHVPFLNIPLGIAPTPTGGFGTEAIYTGEYDGWANFPQDPLNLLADLNAVIGIETVHPFYPGYSADQLAYTIDAGQVGNTDFYFIPENLPILQFMYNGSSTAGQFFGDFFSPWARLVIDWGYGNAGDPGENLTGTLGVNNAGGSGVNGMFLISPDEVANGANIAGSPYQASVGVAGGPWAATPYGDLWDGGSSASFADSGVAGLLMKMDPLQLIAGVQNALIQSVVGPWADVAAGNSATIPQSTLDVINDITQLLRFVTGYDLVNGLDQLLLTGAQDLGLQDLVGDLFTGPLIPGQPIIDVIGGVFDIFNFFGA